MDPDTFITDFERTDNTDQLHAILGRALVIATRFDSMCEAAATFVKLKKNPLPERSLDDVEYSNFVQKLTDTHSTLKANIKSIGLPEDINVILTDARLARNEIAHDITKGLTGCLDTVVNEKQLVNRISELIMDITYGDIAISYTLSVLNNDPYPSTGFVSTYSDKVVQWVVSR